MRPQLGPDLVVKCFTRFSAGAALLAALAFAAQAAPAHQEPPTVTEIETLESTSAPVAGKVLQDTIWIADWTFDAADGSCDDTGWVRYDARIVNDGTNYWGVTTDYAGAGGGRIDNAAAALRKHDLCWGSDGYGNNWDYSIILKYAGSTATLAFKFISDSESGFDFIKVEADLLGLSEARVDYSLRPTDVPATYREELYSSTGNNSAGVTVAALALPDYGPGTHEVYIRFISNGDVSSQDGNYFSTVGAAIVVDEIEISGDLAYKEDFEGELNPNVTFANTDVATPFGEWARLYKHISDNDKCSENTTCAWLWSDPARLASFPDMGFGPGGAVIRNWLDDIIVSPWADLTIAPGTNTTLSFRRFGGNRFTSGAIVQNWSVRSKVRIENTDTTTLGDSVDCVTPWGHTSMFNLLNTFAWVTSIFDATPYFDPGSREVQFSFRVSDWGLFSGAPRPATLNPGPGPYLDRVRIGRRVLSGPVFDLGGDTRMQAQDRFVSVLATGSPVPYYVPSTDRFGTCDFSQGEDQNRNSPMVIPGDSVTVNVLDARLAGGITSVKWYGAIVDGPHTGKSPAPCAVGANGFFEVTASGTVVANRWFVDLDDTYFRGGDRLVYFWYATDAGGGASSAPTGLGSLPASVAAAEVATGGLFEVSSLPTIDWSPDFVARIAADAHGDLEPTPEELAASSQRHCMLYYQRSTTNRRSGATNSTSFMHTLDALGYQGDYDIYDIQGCCASNDLASRTTFEQCTGYQIIIDDVGRQPFGIFDGEGLAPQKVKQATFYRNWLDAGLASQAGRATLWILGENALSSSNSNALFSVYCGVGSLVDDQGIASSPNVLGGAAFTFAPSSCDTDFAGDTFTLEGACPMRRFDGFTPGSTAVVTHAYASGATTGPGAVLMNALPATNANTILMGFSWADIRDVSGSVPGTPEKTLLSKILACTLTPGCQEPLDPTNVPEGDAVDAPAVSALHPNVPNPFNPTTMIAFDLARTGHVRLDVFDVAGRSVRVLVDGEMLAGRGHRVSWNGLDTNGERVSTGLYFYRLVAGDLTATRKMIVVK